jgi:hypothetical protein
LTNGGVAGGVPIAVDAVRLTAGGDDITIDARFFAAATSFVLLSVLISYHRI